MAQSIKGLYNGEPVAIKRLKTQDLTDKAVEELRNEARIMFQLGLESKYIVPLKKICLEAPHYSLVMELMPKGSLYHLLHNGQPTAVGDTVSDCPGRRLGTQRFTRLSHFAPGFKKSKYSAGRPSAGETGGFWLGESETRNQQSIVGRQRHGLMDGPGIIR